MSVYYLPLQHNKIKKENHAYYKSFQIAYKISGNLGKKNDVLYVYNKKGDELSRIRQTSYGFLPRFQLLYKDKYMGSIGFHFGKIHDLIFIRHLNWLITGEITFGKYRIRHGKNKLLEVNPIKFPNGIFYQLKVENDKQAPMHIAIAALLDTWGIKKNRNFLKFPTPELRYKFKMASKIN